ncbi:MAG: hypothetical protein K0S28_591, partial [Paucimonas sp.]|nr:hypothetical protein [Paucimonas sp.]
MRCPRCETENNIHARYCSGCGLLLSSAKSGSVPERTGDASGQRPDLAEPGVKASREPLHAERRANVRKAAHQAAAPLRRNERRRGGDRRVAQRREPYLHERTGAAAPVLPDEENYGYPAAGRHKGWWLAGVLLLLAITGAVVALLASNPKQGMAIVNQGAEMIGLERQESELPKEAQFGTSVEELPYGGTPSVTR